jgi:hypothetical protein
VVSGETLGPVVPSSLSPPHPERMSAKTAARAIRVIHTSRHSTPGSFAQHVQAFLRGALEQNLRTSAGVASGRSRYVLYDQRRRLVGVVVTAGISEAKWRGDEVFLRVSGTCLRRESKCARLRTAGCSRSARA